MRFCFPSLSRLALLLLATGAQVLAQSGSGDLAGSVTDANGAGVNGAKITVSSQDAAGVAVSTESTEAGDYAIASLRPGVYTVRVTAPGFVTLNRAGVSIRTGQRERVDLRLQAGAADQVVNVTADASLLQTESGALSTVIGSQSIVALPLNGRNMISLTTLAPGVSLPPGTLLPRINGGRPRTNEYLYDGVSALQPEPGQVAFFPIIDDINEFAIMSNGVSAEFGRFNGGVVNLTTKAGTSSFHGEVYEFLRNEALNARNYFTPTTSTKPLFRRNQYGAALSGPVLPHRLFLLYRLSRHRPGCRRSADEHGSYAGTTGTSRREWESYDGVQLRSDEDL